MTSAMAAKLNLKLWKLNFIGEYLSSLTKEDIYMKQPEGFVEPGYEEYVCKLIHTIYGTMQGGHDWYKTLSKTYDDLGYTTSCADPYVQFKKENGNYTIQIHIQTIPLALQIMMTRLGGGKKKLGSEGHRGE